MRFYATRPVKGDCCVTLLAALLVSAIIAQGLRGYFATKMLFGNFTCTPTLGLSTSCVIATFPAMLTS